MPRYAKIFSLLLLVLSAAVFGQAIPEKPKGLSLQDKNLIFIYEDDKNFFYLIANSLKPFQDSGYAFSFDVRRDYKFEDKDNPQDIGLKEHFLVMCDRNVTSSPLVIHLRGDGMLGKLEPADFSKGMYTPEAGGYQRMVLEYVCTSQLGGKYKKDVLSTKVQSSSGGVPDVARPMITNPVPATLANIATPVAPHPAPAQPLRRSGSRDNQVLSMVDLPYAISLQVHAPTMFGDKTTVILKNKNPVSYTVKVLVFNKQIDTETMGEKVVSIAPNSDLELKIPPLEGKSYSTPIFVRAFWKLGDYMSSKDAGGFQIPIAAAKVEICQSPDGPLTTHKRTPNAIDFCAPLGSSVVAAKDGVVVEVVDKYTEGGVDPKFYDKDNKVSIYHSDGSVSTYGHMAPKSIRVQLGQRLSAGDQIGEVGVTGQTSGPHVHFMVTYWDEEYREVFLSPRFITNTNKALPIAYKSVINSSGVIEKGAKITLSNPSSSGLIGGKCGNISLDGLTRANDCYLTQNYDEAIQVLNQYIKQNPGSGRAVAMLALSYSRNGQHSMAIPLFQKAISMGRTTYDVYGVYAMSLDATGNIDEAIKMNKLALKIVPGLIDVTRNLYREYMSKGMKSQALALVESFDAAQQKKGRPQYFQSEILQAKQ